MEHSSQTNRHGIPLYGGTPNRCCWSGCTSPAHRELKLPLCGPHARHVHRVWQHDLDVRGAASLAATDRRRQELRAEAEANGVIYYLKNGGGLLKIGWTSQFEKRMRSYAPDSQLLAVQPGSRTEERRIHRMFKVHRSFGNEWYPMVPSILHHIKSVVAEHGEPPVITFGARPTEVPQFRAKSYIGRPGGINLIA